jgi:hypothetical protein
MLERHINNCAMKATVLKIYCEQDYDMTMMTQGSFLIILNLPRQTKKAEMTHL